MTPRERWLTVGLALTGFLLLAVGLWQQVRYADAQQAVKQFVALEKRVAAQNEGDDAEKAALVEQARPEIRNALERGDFDGAVRRLAALTEEERAGPDPEVRGKGLSVDELWPRKSKERAQAKEVLLLLARKQQEGYDLAGAQESLVQVARSARAGKRKEALERFAEVQEQIGAAELRPGFKAARAAEPDPTSPGAPPPQLGGPGAFSPQARAERRQVRQMLQFFQVLLPQMMAQANPEQRAVLQRLQPLGTELGNAYRERKDLRGVMPLLRTLGESIQSQDAAGVDRMILQVRTAIRQAKKLPDRPAVPGPGGDPSRWPDAPGGLPSGEPGAAPPPVLPPAGGPPGRPPGEAGERLLQALDQIRALPEPVYRQQRARIPWMLFTTMSGPPLGPAGPGSPPALGVGKPGEIRLDFGRLGEIRSLRARGSELSGGLDAGGVFLEVPGHPLRMLPIRGGLKVVPQGLTQESGSPEGRVFLHYSEEGAAVAVTVRARRELEGKPAALVLQLPLHAAGWHFSSGATDQIVAVDGTYEARPGADGKLPPVTLRGRGIALAVNAPAAAAIGYEPAGSRLTVRLPLPAGKGLAEYSVRLSLAPSPAAGAGTAVQ